MGRKKHNKSNRQRKESHIQILQQGGMDTGEAAPSVTPEATALEMNNLLDDLAKKRWKWATSMQEAEMMESGIMLSYSGMINGRLYDLWQQRLDIREKGREEKIKSYINEVDIYLDKVKKQRQKAQTELIKKILLQEDLGPDSLLKAEAASREADLIKLSPKDLYRLSRAKSVAPTHEPELSLGGTKIANICFCSKCCPDSSSFQG